MGRLALFLNLPMWCLVLAVKVVCDVLQVPGLHAPQHWGSPVFHYGATIIVLLTFCKYISTPHCKIISLASHQAKTETSVYNLSSFPGHHPAFCHLQYIKAGRVWFVSSSEHNVINKINGITKSEVSRIV